MEQVAPQNDGRWLRGSLAFVWLATGLGAFHPYYREIGRGYLALLGLPDAVMFATCVGEVVLGLRLTWGPLGSRLAAVQAALILGFTLILIVIDPQLLVHPYGVLSKNVPLLAVIGTIWLLEREGWTPRTLWLLRVGMAAIWVSEGVFPKVLFGGQEELVVVANSGLAPGDAVHFLRVLGICEAMSGVAVLLARGALLRGLLVGQITALVVLPLLITIQQPLLWVHPFGPFTKNVPILIGTWLVLRRATGKR